MTRELLKQALDALDSCTTEEGPDWQELCAACSVLHAIRAELAKPEWPEPSGKVLTMADSIADLAGTARPGAEPVATLIVQSRQNFALQFGESAVADWVYHDLAELFEDLRPASLHPTDIYDFAGWLTTRKTTMEVGSSKEAEPMAEAVGEYLRLFPEKFAAPQAQPAAPAPAVREPLTVDSPEVLVAAKKLAEVMSYPWEHMPKQGRATMKANALQVLQAGITGCING